MLMRATMDTERANEALQNGTMQQNLQQAMEQLRPEASYFYEDEGKRAALFVFEMEDRRRFPRPWSRSSRARRRAST